MPLSTGCRRLVSGTSTCRSTGTKYGARFATRKPGRHNMKLQYSGEEKIPVTPATVWAFVSDPNKVARCLPEVIDVMVKDPTHVEAVVQVAVGPVRGKFKLQMELKPDPARQRIELTV